MAVGSNSFNLSDPDEQSTRNEIFEALNSNIQKDLAEMVFRKKLT